MKYLIRLLLFLIAFCFFLINLSLIAFLNAVDLYDDLNDASNNLAVRYGVSILITILSSLGYYAIYFASTFLAKDRKSLLEDDTLWYSVVIECLG
jgi:hypothetical protein